MGVELGGGRASETIVWIAARFGAWLVGTMGLHSLLDRIIIHMEALWSSASIAHVTLVVSGL